MFKDLIIDGHNPDFKAKEEELVEVKEEDKNLNTSNEIQEQEQIDDNLESQKDEFQIKSQFFLNHKISQDTIQTEKYLRKSNPISLQDDTSEYDASEYDDQTEQLLFGKNKSDFLENPQIYDDDSSNDLVQTEQQNYRDYDNDNEKVIKSEPDSDN